MLQASIITKWLRAVLRWKKNRANPLEMKYNLQTHAQDLVVTTGGPAHLCQVSKVTAVKINIAKGHFDVSNTLGGDILTGEVQSITVDKFADIWVTGL
jgi:hypothetical protein